MKVGDRVRVDLSEGCPDRCGRREVYEGEVIALEHPLGHLGMVQVKTGERRDWKPWEHMSCVTVIEPKVEG